MCIWHYGISASARERERARMHARVQRSKEHFWSLLAKWLRNWKTINGVWERERETQRINERAIERAGERERALRFDVLWIINAWNPCEKKNKNKQKHTATATKTAPKIWTHLARTQIYIVYFEMLSITVRISHNLTLANPTRIWSKQLTNHPATAMATKKNNERFNKNSWKQWSSHGITKKYFFFDRYQNWLQISNQKCFAHQSKGILENVLHHESLFENCGFPAKNLEKEKKKRWREREKKEQHIILFIWTDRKWIFHSWAARRWTESKVWSSV